jgi:hypothetical protein
MVDSSNDNFEFEECEFNHWTEKSDESVNEINHDKGIKYPLKTDQSFYYLNENETEMEDNLKLKFTAKSIDNRFGKVIAINYFLVRRRNQFCH